MEWLKDFSDNYANGVMAIAAVGAFVLAAVTLWYLKREYSSKYRPYVFPIVHAEPMPEKLGCVLSVIPQNIGPHPCKAQLSKIRLHIGDEMYEAPDTKEWLLLAPQGMGVQMPVGHVNDVGVSKIREGRFRKNRVEVTFILSTVSVEDEFREEKLFVYEVDVLGEKPQVLFRPEWSQDA